MTAISESDLLAAGAAWAETVIQQDPGNRGLEQWAVQGPMRQAVESLIKGDHIYLATGFFILRAGQIETDGPPGAIVLADALVKCGKKVTLIYDDHSDAIMQAGLAYGNSRIQTRPLPVRETVDPEHFLEEDVTHLVALERPGKASDGKYYNFRGQDISDYHFSLDELFRRCPGDGVQTIGIGDGGNELGMGVIAHRVRDFHQLDRPFDSVVEADYCVCAGVSNWAGYAMAALLSALYGQNVMLPPHTLWSLLQNIVSSGAVDGVSAKAECTVDGLEASWEKDQYSRMYNLAALLTKEDRDWLPVSYPIGDSCLCWSLGDSISEQTVKRVLALYAAVKDSPVQEGIRDLVPSYKSLAVHFDPAAPALDALLEGIQNIVLEKMISFCCEENDPELEGKNVVLPVLYDGEDLPRVAELNNLTVDEVIRIHREGRYTVAMVGFKPHFPYLLGLDPRLETGRLESPRTRIPAGAVAIGGAQTGVYPEESPGGWNLIGMTDPELLKKILPGDLITIEEVKSL
ncbi:MAG: DUF4392 domain-containing protein [Spirochaetales bacterium]|nr:DUF4392 domain-containing protein [Spirochaetales bacterium]